MLMQRAPPAQVPRYARDDIATRDDRRFELSLELVNQHLDFLNVRSCSTLEQPGNVIGRGCRVLHDDVGAFAVSTIRTGDSESNFRAPLDGRRVPLTLDIYPPRAFGRSWRIDAYIRIRQTTLQFSLQLLQWCC
jgi:hypothetical protein